MGYSGYKRAMQLMGVTPGGEDFFNSIVAEVHKATTEELSEQINACHADIRMNADPTLSFRAALLSKTPATCTAASVDGSYLNPGHHSTHMSASAICKDNQCLLALVHVSNSPDDEGPGEGYTVRDPGTAKTAEGVGIAHCLQALVAAGISTAFIVADNDTKVEGIITELMPDTKIIACFNHFCRALSKRLQLVCDKKSAMLPVQSEDGGHNMKSKQEEVRCMCAGGRHRWTGASRCGCPTKASCKKLQSEVFALGTY
jgi:hypothetical protein